jgi:multidrug efflux pump subunit AcrB
LKKLIRYFIRKSLFVTLITFFVITAGIINLRTIKKEGVPQVDQKLLRITTLYPGASPEDVELNVTIPIEDALKGVDGIDKYDSVSAENYSKIWVHLDKDAANPEKIKADIRSAVDSVSDLPKEVKDRPNIWEWKISNMGILQMGVFSGTLPEKQLRVRANDLKKKILALPRVSKNYEGGIRDREIHIKLNLKKLNEYHIAFEEVVQAIKANNIQISGGMLESYNAEKAIVTFAKFKGLFDVENIIVRSTFEGDRILLKDIAQIVETFEEELVKFRFNGKNGMMINAVKKQSADIIKTVSAIKKCVADYKKSLKDEDIDFAYLWDMSEETITRLTIVQRNAIIGFVFVVITLLLFLNLRNAFWTALGIPFSFCFAVLFFPLFDVTINSVTLLAVVVVLGMIVDDAIIITENIYRHRIEGELPLQAGINATEEVVYPVISTILTTIVAFLPIIFIAGMIGDFAKTIPIVVALALIGSLIEALFLLPNHVTRFSKGRTEKTIGEKKFIAYFKEKYGKFLYTALRYRYLVIGIFLLLSGFTLYLVQYHMKFEMFPDADANTFWVYGKTKEIKSLEYTSDKIKELESFILESYDRKSLRSFLAEIGSGGYPENFNIVFYLNPPAQRDITADGVIIDLRKKIEEMDVFSNIHFEKDTGGPPTGRGLEIQVIGNEAARRKDISNSIVKYLEGTGGVFDIDRTDEERRKELKIIPNRERIAKYGVTAYNIAAAIKIAYNGLTVTDMLEENEKINYRIMLDDKSRSRITTLDRLKTMNKQGKLIPISQMVTVKEGLTSTHIRHYNSDKSTVIMADVNSKVITPSEIYSKIKEDFKYFAAGNPGFQLVLGGEAEESVETLESMLRSLYIAIAGIAFILILLFRSILQPVMVMFAIPFGLIGVVFAFYAHGMTLSVMGLLGMIGLSGVVVNDSLVMVEFMNMLKKKNPGRNILDIARDGAVMRLRPILLTTITTCASVFPTAYGLGGTDIMIRPSTLSLFWGLIFATTLTLILIPCLYVIEYTLKETVKQLLQKIKPAKLSLMLLLLTFLSAGALHSIESKVIKLSDFIKDSKNNNPEIFSKLTELKTSKSKEIQAKAIRDIVFNFHYNNLSDKPFSDFDAVQVTDQNTVNMGIELGGIVPKLGTRVRTGVEYNEHNLKFNSTPLLPFTEIDYYNPEIYLSLSHPLLKNWLGIIDELPIRQSELNNLIVKESVEEGIENIISGFYGMYFDWYLLYHQHRIYKTQLKNSKILLDQTEKKYKRGLADKSDLSKVKVMKLEYSKATDSVGLHLKSKTDKIYTWKTGKQPLSGLPAEAGKQPQAAPDIIPEEELTTKDVNTSGFSIDNTRQMKILSLSKSILDYRLAKEKNENLPELDLVFSGKKRNYTTDSEKAFEGLNYENYLVGVTFKYPFGSHLSKGRIKETSAKLEKWDKDAENYRRVYTRSYEELKNILKVYEKALEYDRKLIKQAEIQSTEEEKKYKQGRSDLFFVIQYRNTLLNYRLAYLKDYTDYKKAIIQLFTLLDTL